MKEGQYIIDRSSQKDQSTSINFNRKIQLNNYK